jgi:hypothetical protein
MTIQTHNTLLASDIASGLAGFFASDVGETSTATVGQKPRPLY